MCSNNIVLCGFDFFDFLFAMLDKNGKIGYDMCRGCISALNEKLIKRASLGSKQDI